MVISVAICTYKRPQQLFTCIESVLAQDTRYNFEVVIIDNDANFSAQTVANSFSNTTKIIRYIKEPLTGLAKVRNTAILNCKGDFIAFIDDDEYAATDWLEKLMETMQNFQADVVLGKVVYEIPESYPKFIRESEYFNRVERSNGQIAIENEGYTGNVLMKRNVVQSRPGPFLEVFNKTGGEDSEFFNFALGYGFKIVFSNDAVIFEVQDGKRLNRKWYLIRGYRSGYLYSEKTLADLKPATIFILIKSILGGLGLSTHLLLKSIFSFNKNHLSFIYKISNQLGKIGYFVGIKLNEY